MNQISLNYEEFVGNLRQQLYQIIPRDVEMEMHRVTKNNSLQLDGLVLYNGEITSSPNFYMQDYYRRYQQGEEVPRLAQEIYTTWNGMAGEFFLESPSLPFEICKDFIFYRLVNREKNRELLEEIPFVPVFDLAMIFYYLVNSGEEGIQSIRISRSIMNMWETDRETLLDLASSNTPRLFPAKYCPLLDVIEGLGVAMPEDAAWYGTAEQPYILTNDKGINGASVWLYPGQLEEIARLHDSDFYILPSSIHELLIMPQAEEENFQTRAQEDQLLEMVQQVNRECVATEEYLSDNIYFYDKEKKAIKILYRD